MKWIPFVLLASLFAGCNSKPESVLEAKLTVDSSIANAGAIVCSHVVAGEPILRAVREEPMDPADSGWQFLCNSGADENIENAQLWTVNQVTERDPSLLTFINSPVGTTMSRSDATSDWEPSQ